MWTAKQKKNHMSKKNPNDALEQFRTSSLNLTLLEFRDTKYCFFFYF